MINSIRGRFLAMTRFQRSLILVAIIGLTLRLVWLCLVADIGITENNDQADYVLLGQAWADGEFRYWNYFYRSPLYPAIVAIIELARRLVWFDIPLRLSIGLLNAVLATLSIVLIGLLGKRYFGSTKVGLVAAWLYALWPNQIAATGVVMSEPISTFLFLCLIAVVWWHRPDTLTPKHRFVAGMLCGALWLVKPVFVFSFIGITLLVTLAGKANWRLVIRRALAFGLGVIIMVAPWQMWLSLKSEAFTLRPNIAGGFNLCLGNNDAATGTWSEEAISHCPFPRGGNQGLHDDKTLQVKGLQWAFANLEQQPRLIGARLSDSLLGDSSYWFGFYPDINYQGPFSLIVLGGSAWIYGQVAKVIALTGWILAIRKKAGYHLWSLSFVLAVTMVIPALTVGESRYHDHLVPFIAIFAAYVATTLRSRQRSSSEHHDVST